jgi:hypothetical protein
MIRVASLSEGFVVVFVLSFLGLTPTHWQTMTTGDDVLVKLQHDRAEARKHADIAFLENFYAKEFTVGNMDGSESSRAKDLSMFSSGDLKPTVISDEQMTVYVYD